MGTKKERQSSLGNRSSSNGSARERGTKGHAPAKTARVWETRRPTNSTETQIQTGNLSHSRNQKVSKIDRFVDSKITLRQAHSRDLQRVYGSTDAMDRGGAVSVARIV